MPMNPLRIALPLGLAVALAACGAETAPTAEHTNPAWKSVPVSGDYALKECVVSGEKLGAEGMKPYAIEYKGTQIQFCCKDCVAKFEKDPDKYLAMVKAAKK